MRYKVVAVRDRVADVFGVPTHVQSVGSAIRSFGDAVRRPSSDQQPNPFYDHPGDFDLFLLGEFDDATGTYDVLIRPEQIALGKDYATQ